MRQFVPQGGPSGSMQDQIDWLHQQIVNIASASGENDPMIIAQNYTVSGAYTEARTFDVTAATLGELRIIVATLLADLQRGGANRTT